MVGLRLRGGEVFFWSACSLALLDVYFLYIVQRFLYFCLSIKKKKLLSNMPIYLMSLFSLPRGVKFRLEKIQRDFLWEGVALKGKFIWLTEILFARAKRKRVWG